MTKPLVDMTETLARLSALTIFELRGGWRRLHRAPPPMRLSRDLLMRAIAYKPLPEMYDDGGLSGGTMERPALQRLLADIKASKVQIVVVYKVDRLTRSLADFAKIVDVLDAHDASFVSVTQQFNTTTSMGRLTLNMLLSFAQFEREIAGERIRDKIAASKAKGMWTGGNVPLGYDVKDHKLVVNEAEASTVRMIFRRYAELGSVALLKAELDRTGIVSKRREGAGGALSGGKCFSRGALLGMNKFRLTSLVRLSYLSPVVVRALLAGRHPIELTPTRLLRLSKDLPHDWQEQRRFLGFAA